MAVTYGELAQKVYDWSNRDTTALPPRIVDDALQYAADKAYRTLRVPPLEHIVTYSAELLAANTTQLNSSYRSVTRITIPGDLIEFIQLREVNNLGQTVRVFNEKADIRTFQDQYAEKYDLGGFWTREADSILYSPGYGSTLTQITGPAASLELYYYRRLPALNARYNVSLSNWLANLNTTTAPTDNADTAEYMERVPAAAAVTGTVTYTILSVSDNGLTYTFAPASITGTTVAGGPVRGTNVQVLDNITVMDSNNNTATVRSALVNGNIVADFAAVPAEDATITATETINIVNAMMEPVDYYGIETPNWLREQNERVVLFGALAEVFAYLQEDDQAQKYAQIFFQEIQELNDEDRMRNASGGNIQQNFNGRGLI